ncbi:MAG TPA: acyl-CoA thioesterase [Lysobacter sp.]|nr:acyl-CoA thioesterase [Lysobacter sp.]
MTRSDAPREARLWEIVFPDHANHLGTLFGGQALAWMDKAAFVAATRYARRTTVVTARSEQVDFHVPVRQGQLVELVARVTGVGRSSMRVEVELNTEDPHAGTRHLCTRGHFTMIALDSSGRPAPVESFEGAPPAD